MFEFAKKGFFLGLGLASFTKEKAEAFAHDFAQRAKLTEEEGRRFADYLKDESAKARDGLRETVDAMVKKAMDKAPCTRHIEALNARIERLEKLAAACCPEKAAELGLGAAGEGCASCGSAAADSKKT